HPAVAVGDVDADALLTTHDGPHASGGESIDEWILGEADKHLDPLVPQCRGHDVGTLHCSLLVVVRECFVRGPGDCIRGYRGLPSGVVPAPRAPICSTY